MTATMTEHVAETMSAELKAMVQVEAAFAPLQDEERNRVLRWANSKFGVRHGNGKGDEKFDFLKEDLDKEEAEGREFEDFATFYDAAGPDSDADKALVAAYWFQVKKGEAEVEAQKANSALKNLGHGIGHITRAFEGLKGLKPALVVQTRKEGSSQQARKKFKVTTEGQKAVERMLRAE